MHWSRRLKLKEIWTQLFLNQTDNRHSGKVRIHFTHYYRGRAIEDADNLTSTSKIPLDAIKEAKIITDDKMSIIGMPTFSQVKVKLLSQVKTVIEIEDL